MLRRDVTLDDKYTERSGRIYISGVQAMVRLPILQRQLDTANNLKTGVFISGYRGSPLGTYDMALRSAQKHLDAYNIKFVPGVNEDLGATAVWGSQQLQLGPGAQYDGVVGMWYGKGPGVDRSLDAIKHANAAGTSKYGGVLAFAGDDHACKSSTFPHQSEYAFMHSMVPVLNPAGIEDALNLGLYGIAMSRYSGCWVGFKVISDFADSSASVFSDPFALTFKTPDDFDMPKDGLNIRWYDPPVAQEERLIKWKLPAAQAYARANGLDRFIINPPKKRITIVTTGKAYMDTMQAMDDIGLSRAQAESMGLGLYKVALTWPIDEISIKRLAQETDEILVIEEKRGVMEEQIRRILFNIDASKRPRVVGKTDETGAPLLPEHYELSTVQITETLIRRLKNITDTSSFDARMDTLRKSFGFKGQLSPVVRMPHYCSGCPHNTSTVIPDGSRGLGGIGCHYMVMWMPRKTMTFTQMGGEGATWIGQAPFTNEKHIFVNLGDGTYFHSGILAIRAAVAAKINITYKILYNDAVAMTGGQHVDGDLSVPLLIDQVRAEGVKNIIVMSDYPEKYTQKNIIIPSDIRVTHRNDLDKIQREMRDMPGVSVLIYEQTCAAEKRRRRKRGLMEDPAKRIMINERVCEGCGDCGKQSNCLSIAPVETEFGKKRQIDQSTCNKDYSCVKGFCPSFVTITGGALRKPQGVSNDTGVDAAFAHMPEPDISDFSAPTSIFVTGVGGTGIVTIGAIMAMAAHLENKGCTTMDQTGLAQKGGAVTSHIRIAKNPEDIKTVRVAFAGATTILGGDLLVTADGESLSKINPGKTFVILNTHKSQTGEFTQNPEWKIPVDQIIDRIGTLCGKHNMNALEATDIATALLGDSIATNMFLLGYAYQKGRIPLSQDAIMRAIELNATAVKMNQSAFIWGRRAAFDLAKVMDIALPKRVFTDADRHHELSTTVDELIRRRMESLTRYQSKGYAAKYLNFVEHVRAADIKLNGKPGALTENVARYYYKLMAYKDEYEVARLYTDGAFLAQVKNTFEGDYKFTFNMAPPSFAPRGEDGHLKKMQLGPWFINALKMLAKLRILRGTPLDIFSYTQERRTERQLIKDYKTAIDALLTQLTKDNYGIAAEIAGIPEFIRGYGHVKEDHLKKAKIKEAELMARFKNGGTPTAPQKEAA